MKLPRSKQTELAKKGKRDLPNVSGGGAKGRLRQFEQERGISETGLSNPSADESEKDTKKPKRSRKK